MTKDLSLADFVELNSVLFYSVLMSGKPISTNMVTEELLHEVHQKHFSEEKNNSIKVTSEVNGLI